MNDRLIFSVVLVAGLVCFSACEKWVDHPGDKIDFSRKYCNNPAAINYNWGFPGIEDSTVCIFPAEPFLGRYTYQDSVYAADASFVPGNLIEFDISQQSRTQISLNNFCSNDHHFLFRANTYYRAESDSIIGQGTQLMCREADTLSGTLEYRPADSSLYLEFKVLSDTGTSIHKGRAYKK